MPFFERENSRIYYEVSGQGEPVLLFAPGGMRSEISFWANMPWHPVERLSSDFQVIAMDQRNAGQSTAAVAPGEGWASYTSDHLALLDHLGIERCHLLGCCIGGSFIASFLNTAPERASSAVMLQPIGSTSENRSAFSELFDGWAEELTATQPDVSDTTWAGFKENMFGGDFVYCATPDDVRKMQTPLLVLTGNDLYHPEQTSREIAELAPNSELIESWKEPESAEQALDQVRAFLKSNSGPR